MPSLEVVLLCLGAFFLSMSRQIKLGLSYFSIVCWIMIEESAAGFRAGRIGCPTSKWIWSRVCVCVGVRACTFISLLSSSSKVLHIKPEGLNLPFPQFSSPRPWSSFCFTTVLLSLSSFLSCLRCAVVQICTKQLRIKLRLMQTYLHQLVTHYSCSFNNFLLLTWDVLIPLM